MNSGNQVSAVRSNVTITPMDMLSTAVQSGADLDKLEKLMDLQQRWEASEAKKAFASSLAEFQSQLGPIIKTRQAHNSKYADLDDIAQAIRPILLEQKLSYRFEQSQEQGILKVACVVTHASGHSETAEMSAPADNSGGKNSIQALASTVTYLRRYTLTGALGITTGNEDSDGGKPAITVDDLLAHNQVIRDEFQSIAAIKAALADQNYSYAKEAWNELDEQTQRAIWRAPTKGGLLTTVERTQMKSTQWSEA